MCGHLDEQALSGMAGLDHAALRKRPLACIEVEPRLPLLLVRTVAGKAVGGEDREDVPGEADGRATRLVLRPHTRGSHGHDYRETRCRENRRANVAAHTHATYWHRMTPAAPPSVERACSG